MPFELRSPTGLWLLGLMAPLVLLYILKIRRERLRIPSTWLWAVAQRDLLAKSPFKRLIVQLPLILQLLVLLLLGLCLARPATRGGSIVGDHVAIVIDASASMSATDAQGKQRMDLGRQAAHDLLRALGPGSDALVIEAGRDARVASPLDRDKRRLDAAIDRIVARDVEGDLGRSVAIAADRLRQLPGKKRIVVVTDGALARPEGLAEASIPVDLVTVGSPVDNVGVVRVDVRSGVDPATKQDQVQAFAMLQSFATAPRDVFVTLRQKGVVQTITSRKLRLLPNERAPVVLTFEPTRGDLGTGLIVEISPGDALAADDRAFGRVPPGRRLPVVLAPAEGNAWVKRALDADPDVELLGATLAGLSTADVPADALVVVDGACPEGVPGSDLVILNPPAGRCRNAVVGKLVEKPQITSWAESDARLRFVGLDGVTLLSAHRIEVEGPTDTLISASEGVIASDISGPGRTGTLLGFDVGDSTWPLKASFVLFVRNLVEQARTHRQSGITGPAKTGEPLRARVPPDATEVELEAPDGTKTKLAAKNGLCVVPEVGRAGFYHLSWQGARPGSVLVAANLASEAESDLRPKPLPKLASGASARRGEEIDEAFTEWTWLLAALALLLIAFDVWWLTRRPRLASSGKAARPKLPERRAA